ncbi:MAG: ATP-binding protein [Planctomycetota bacterium]|nr:ATP-binding protein [Planctomycetota bacterium]
MATDTRVTKEVLARELVARLEVPLHEAVQLLDKVFDCMREHLHDGAVVEIDDLLSIAVSGKAELREDESGGFAAFAPKKRTLSAKPIGAFRTSLERSRSAAIYYLSPGNEEFSSFLSDHFGRRGWRIIHCSESQEALDRIESDPPVALLLEAKVPGWRDILREVKCNPRTNGVPAVAIYSANELEQPIPELSVDPDDIVCEPFEMQEFIQTAGNELAARVATPRKDLIELTLQLPGTQRERQKTRQLVEEVLYRCTLPEAFIESAGSALHEAMDNAYRHGHQNVECCTLQVRLILDPRRLVLDVRDTGEGFDHASVLSAARGSLGRGEASSSARHLLKAANALRTRRGGPAEGGLARMLTLVDRIDFNRVGNEVVLTKFRPR